jgi:hypothetical protein
MGKLLAAASQAVVYAVFETGWRPNLLRFEGEGQATSHVNLAALSASITK